MLSVQLFNEVNLHIVQTLLLFLFGKNTIHNSLTSADDLYVYRREHIYLLWY